MVTDQPLKVEVSAENPSVMTLTGEMDFRTIAEFRQKAAPALSGQSKNLRIHMQGVSYIDSSGLSALLEVVKSLTERGGTVTLVDPSFQIQRVMNISGFSPFFQFEKTSGVGEEPRREEDNLPSEEKAMESFETAASPESVSYIRKSVVIFARQMPFSKQEIADINLAVGEASCNALRHGSPTGRESIHVTCIRHGGRLTVQITDSGPGFDPDNGYMSEAEDLAEGGRGIFFIRNLMDEVRFRFNGGTTVEMVKYLNKR